VSAEAQARQQPVTHSPRQGLVPVRQLTDLDRREIEALAALCRQYEGADLPLYLECCTGDQICHLCYYQRDTLVGIAMAPPGDPVEVLGMVHPEHRRRGIGRALLGAVQHECRRRGVSSLLLVCEGAAPSGVAFARAVGAELLFSEYRMELDRAAFAQCPSPTKTLELRLADARDIDALVSMWIASRDVSKEDARQVIVRWLGQDDQRFYIGRLQSGPVGMLRLHLEPFAVFIHSFIVHPEHRGRGYGRQILMGTIDDLLAEAWEHIMIEVATDNTVALSLYESCGFRRIATYEYYERLV
jgi:ribosomal protein S18 acetylase RimI-like enzyme